VESVCEALEEGHGSDAKKLLALQQFQVSIDQIAPLLAGEAVIVSVFENAPNLELDGKNRWEGIVERVDEANGRAVVTFDNVHGQRQRVQMKVQCLKRAPRMLARRDSVVFRWGDSSVPEGGRGALFWPTVQIDDGTDFCAHVILFILTEHLHQMRFELFVNEDGFRRARATAPMMSR
jgi:hypothetical protein